MTRYKKGPIQRFSWGRFVINGSEHSDNGKVVGKGKDIRLIGDTISEWSEREGHRLKREMITGVYGKDVKVLIIGVGVEKRVKCPKKVIRDIRRHGIKSVVIKSTPKACKEFNKLHNKGLKVALLAHGTY